ncbi:hypothetical protein NQ314_006284 [Rhamnusium bicolor]|uniref:Peptidase S1 domain-containing protein n=1 Tax=Rhamnusium bicolor TaxID=1586634 RepID=A0AAV8Z7S0_9CUCU|nr:hypothetical protein NQ314_006284 [Rhamnusium bicolor]
MHVVNDIDVATREFKCRNTEECIDDEKRCDGSVDCRDGSDEFNDCKTIIESDQFQCKSGQCISNDDKCNGIPDCDDKSDEIKETCLNMYCPGFTFKCDYGACVDGDAKCNGVKDCLDNSDEEDCAPVITPSPAPTKKPIVTPPITDSGACELPEHPDFGQWSIVGGAEGIPKQKVQVNTALEYGCNIGYKLSTQICGEKKVSAEPLIVNGQTVEKGDYPWVTAIYQYIEREGVIKNVCGGSMLTQKIILTAAHCVTIQNGKLVPKENIIVGVGKYYNKYRDPRDTQSQYSKIDKIIVPTTYKGDYQRYGSDIALLVTTDVLLLSKIVQPVCYLYLPNIYLDEGLTGVITGWGYTLAKDRPSEELREISVPFKPDSECQKELPSDWADKYYTPDKMCAGHYNKSIAVCKGDSGGGLVFKNNKDNRYYVHGIVSIGHGLEGSCNIQVSALYTKVAYHYEWLEKTISQYFSV